MASPIINYKSLLVSTDLSSQIQDAEQETTELSHAADVSGVTLKYPKFNENIFSEVISANKTLDANDCGKVLYVDTDAVVLTLPATAAGLTFIVVNAGDDGKVAINISPAAVDNITGVDLAGTDNKDLINTKATAINGDFVKLVGNGAGGYFVTEMCGTWAAEA